MYQYRTRIVTVALVCVCMLAGGALAADMAGPKRGDSYGVSYMSGGLSDNERTAMKGMEKDYSVKCVFSLQSGHMVGNVDVTVTNAAGKTVFEILSPGPWLYIDLQKGSYTMKARYEGQTKTKSLSVPASGMTMAHVTWDGDETGFTKAE